MTRDEFNKQLENLIEYHSNKYEEQYQQNEEVENTDADSLADEGYHDGFSDGVSAAWALFINYEKGDK